MYSILIVDDEKEIREGLAKLETWQEWGFSQVYMADDGDTAIQMALQYKPEIILSDIKMPRISGLEMAKILLEQHQYGGKIVIISGYDEFEYVREAFKIGVTEYLLKPIDISELENMLRKAVMLYNEEQVREKNELMLRNQSDEAIPRIRQELMQELVERPFSSALDSRLQYRLPNLQMDWLLQNELTVMVLETDNLKSLLEGKGTGEKELILFTIGNVLEHTLLESGSPNVSFLARNESWISILSAGAPDWLTNTQRLAEMIIHRLNQFAKVRVTIGLSSSAGTFVMLHSLFLETSDALHYKTVFGGNKVFLSNGQIMGEIGMNPDILEQPKELIEMMKYGSEQELKEMMKNFIELVRKWGVQHPRDLQQRSFEWLLELFRNAKKAGWNETWWEKNPLSLWNHIEKFDTPEPLQKQLERYVLESSASFQYQLMPQSQIIVQAEQYIRQHYTDNISLLEAADHVHVSPVWLSKLFKKEKDTTFLEFLTDLRMEKAKELLLDVNLKVYQICETVGYRDTAHFSRLFKKKVGFSPKEYRNHRGIPSE
jgi:two-component system response regulator YesN